MYYNIISYRKKQFDFEEVGMTLYGGNQKNKIIRSEIAKLAK